MSEPPVGPEILHVLSQLKGLQLSEYAKYATAALEKPAINSLGAVISTVCLVMKYPLL